jgi:hypothetical protein
MSASLGGVRKAGTVCTLTGGRLYQIDHFLSRPPERAARCRHMVRTPAASSNAAIGRARRALRFQRLEVPDREDSSAAIVRCTADPAKADKRTRSKWNRVMRYAAAYKPDAEPLDQFIQRKGGINESAARFGRCVGRGGPPRR